MPECEAKEYLDASLRVAKGRLKLVTAATAGGAWLAGTILSALLFVVLDHWLPGGMSDTARVTATRLYLLASAAWVAAAAARPLARRINDLYAARMIERWHREFRNTLVDALQLSRHAELPGSVRAAVIGQAAGEVTQVDVRASVPTGRLRWAGCAVAATLMMFGMYAAVSPKPVLPSLMRAFGSGIGAPTRTRIGELSPDDRASVLCGEPVRFQARIGGRRPAEAFVRFSLDGGATWVAGQQLELDPPSGDASEGVWQAVKAARDVQRSMAWQVVAGDARSEIRHLQVRPVPEITAIDLRYDYPPYTRLPPTTQPGGEIDAIVGTKVTIRASASGPIHDPILVTGQSPAEKRRVLAGPSPEAPTELAATLTVVKDDVYRIEYRDDHGEPNREPILHPIHARPDRSPTIRIDRPGRQAEMLAEEVFSLAARVEDDFGLTGAALSYRRAGERSATDIPLALVSQGQRPAGEIDQRIALSQMNARAGEVIEWWVSAWDNREDLRGQAAYQRGESEIRRLVIREPERPPERAEEDEDREVEPPSEPSDGDTGKQQPTTDDVAGEDTPPGDGQDTLPATQPSDASETQDQQRALGDFAQAHTKELSTLAKYLPEPGGTDAGANRGNSPGEEQGEGRGEGQGEGQSEGDQQTTATDGRGQGQGEGQEQGDGRGEGQGEGQSEGGQQTTAADRRGQGQGEGQEQGDGRGEGQGEGQNEGDQQTTTTDGRGQGEGEEQEQGDGQGEGQGEGQSEGDQQTTAADGRGQGEGEEQEQGDGRGEGQGEGQSEGDQQTTAADGRGQGQGEEQEQGDGRGEGQGEGQSSQSVPGGGGSSATGGGGRDSSVVAPSPPEQAPARPDPIPPASTPAAVGRQILPPGRVEHLMDALDRALRKNQVPPEMLDELGWELPRAEQFVDNYERTVTGGQPQVAQTTLPAETAEVDTPGDGNRRVLRADSGAAPGVRGLNATHQRSPDATHDLMEVGRQRVPRRYQPLLEAFYNSVSTQPAD